MLQTVKLLLEKHSAETGLLGNSNCKRCHFGDEDVEFAPHCIQTMADVEIYIFISIEAEKVYFTLSLLICE